MGSDLLLSEMLRAFRRNLHSYGIGASHLPVVRSIIHANIVRDKLRNAPVFRYLYRGFGYESPHPFDRVHGTETSGFVSERELPRSAVAATDECYWGSAYWGSQPSFVRAAIAALPAPQSFTFIDLGCGKGRALIVASEVGFQHIIGIELSPGLAEIGRKNARIIETKFPARTPISVQVGDASTFQFPSGNIVVYIYNPFGREVLTKVLAALEAAIVAERREVYLVYMYPSLLECIDASPGFKRYFETTVTFAPEEVGYGDVSAPICFAPPLCRSRPACPTCSSQ
jgi:SAM-dependent methyltransferase